MEKKVVPLRWEGGEEIGTAVVFPDGRVELIIWPGVRPDISAALEPDLSAMSIGLTYQEIDTPRNTLNEQLPPELQPKFRPQNKE